MNEPMVPPVKVGDRVRLTGPMLNDPDPISVGDEGTVDWVGDWQTELTQQVGVRWDSGRTLNLVKGDRWQVIAQLDN